MNSWNGVEEERIALSSSMLQTLLQRYFGYNQFRPLQQEIVEHVLQRKDALVLMPTGGGKSLCFQLPALAFPGMTLVVSPLIALMKDQVDALRENGVEAAYLNSTLSFAEAQRIQHEAEQGHLKLLYAAPERLAQPWFQQWLQRIDLSCIAVDEAHCISEWGHDFRPEYRQLATLRQLLPNLPCVALTATANERVRKDIIAQLRLENGRVFSSSFNRPNLTYHIRQKRQSFEQLLELLGSYQGASVIIYCVSRKDTERIASGLTARGFKASPYHAGLAPEARAHAQERFIRDEAPIIVATIAFGMGIDKPNVRLVVHLDLPKSVEGYYQETGRAGRDGLPSNCVLFYSAGDRFKQDFFIDQLTNEQEQQRARKQLAEMIAYCETNRCRRRHLLQYFGEVWEKERCDSCDRCLTPASTVPKQDYSKEVSALAALILSLRGAYGVEHVLDIARGAKVKKIRDRGHDRLPGYGSLAGRAEDELKHIMREALEAGLFKKEGDRYPVIVIPKETSERLAKNEPSLLPAYVPLAAAARPALTVRSAVAQDESFDHALFDRLRVLRKRLADERHVPAYVIFGDRTLQECARKRPQTKAAFATIFGVGQAKLEAFGEVFVREIQAVSAER